MHDISLTSRVLDYLYSFREFDEFCALKFIDEACAIKYALLIGHIPPGCRGCRILQIMGYPYFLSALLRKFVSDDLTVTYHGEEGCMLPYDSGGRLSRKNGQVLAFAPVAFELERETNPFPDGHFDLLVAIDVLEHVVENPSFVVSEFHRVLREDGTLILSTAHALRFAHVLSMLKGENVYEPYHGMGIWGRNCREYTMAELKPLLESSGFTMQYSIVEDIHPAGRHQKKTLGAFRELLDLTFPAGQGGRGYGDQLYIVASRAGRRRYSFPAPLYAPEKVDEESLVPPALRENAGWALPFIEIGFNDWLQLLDGWHEPESDCFPVRRVKERGNAVLRNDLSRRLLVLEAALPGDAESTRKPHVIIDGAVPSLLEGKTAIAGRPGMYRWLYHVPEGKGFLRHISVKRKQVFECPGTEVQSGGLDTGDIALSYLGLFPAHRLIMGTNDHYLLLEGWKDLGDGPPLARWAGRKASLRLISPGGRQNLKLTCFLAPRQQQPPLILTAGNYSFELPVHTQGVWLTQEFLLEAPLNEVLLVTIEVGHTGSPVQNSDESGANTPEPGIAISYMELVPR